MQRRATRLVLPLVLVAALAAGVAIAAVAAMAGTRASGGTVMTAKSSKYGVILVGASGKTLYRFSRDGKNVSVCKGACAGFWPPLVLKAGVKPKAGSGVSAGLLGTMKRSKGLVQVTYAGFPLYWYSGDHKSGDVNGEGFKDYNGQWFVVNAKGALVKKAVSSGGGSSGGGWG